MSPRLDGSAEGYRLDDRAYPFPLPIYGDGPPADGPGQQEGAAPDGATPAIRN